MLEQAPGGLMTKEFSASGDGLFYATLLVAFRYPIQRRSGQNVFITLTFEWVRPNRQPVEGREPKLTLCESFLFLNELPWWLRRLPGGVRAIFAAAGDDFHEPSPGSRGEALGNLVVEEAAISLVRQTRQWLRALECAG